MTAWPQCDLCHGKGTYHPACSMCCDSSYDHECPGPRECWRCARTRALREEAAKEIAADDPTARPMARITDALRALVAACERGSSLTLAGEVDEATFHAIRSYEGATGTATEARLVVGGLVVDVRLAGTRARLSGDALTNAIVQGKGNE